MLSVSGNNCATTPITASNDYSAGVTMSANLPNPEDVNVDDIQQFIENMPEEKRQELLSRVGAGVVGGNLGM